MSGMTQHPSYLVYQHLPPFTAHRGLKVVKGDTRLAKDRFIAELDQLEYFRVDAEDKNGLITVIIILAVEGRFSSHGPKLRDLVGALGSEEAARAGRLLEVMLVAPEPVTKKTNITEIINEFRLEAQKGKTPARYYNMYPYHVLSLEVPRCTALHEIASPAEVRAFLAREKRQRSDLKRIQASSPPVVWIGARPGEVVKIVAPSETAGESYDYRLVIKS